VIAGSLIVAEIDCLGGSGKVTIEFTKKKVGARSRLSRKESGLLKTRKGISAKLTTRRAFAMSPKSAKPVPDPAFSNVMLGRCLQR